jgi:hypothetical protein
MIKVLVDTTKEFTQDGKKYMFDLRGLGGMVIGMPVHKDRHEYVACKATMVVSENKLYAQISDDDFERIGQPDKFTCGVVPLATKREGDVTIVTNGEIKELYYDDSTRIISLMDAESERKMEVSTSQPMSESKSPSDSIIAVCDSVKEMLLEKNRKYGNSALNPCRVFSKADSVEQLKVRIDDKINRIKNEQNDEDEDVVKDLIGYLVLLVIARNNTATED